MKTRSASPRRMVPTVVMLTAALALAACDDDDDDGGGTTVPTTSTTTPTVEQANVGPASVKDYALSLGIDVDTENGGECDDLFSMPGEAILYISPSTRRELTTQDLWERLSGVLRELELDPDTNQLAATETPADPVFRLELVNSLRAAQLDQFNERLAGEFGPDNVVIDLNHVGPFLPAPTFHPAGDPVPAAAGSESTSSNVQDGEHRVLVVDSPDDVAVDEWTEAWTGAASDRGADGKVDFVTGHGAFVVDLIERLAPSADVSVSGVVHEPVGVDIPGFLFTELDVVRAVERGLDAVEVDGAPENLPGRAYAGDPADLVNFSLGTVGCRAADHDVLARVLNDVLTLPYRWDGTKGANGAGAETMFVAAAGNDGLEAAETGTALHPHYPAGFAVAGPPLGDHVIGVGANDENGDEEEWSNTCVVSAWAPGTATAAFPWLATTPQLATWNGTSFATAYVTAALVDDPDPVASTWSDAVTNGHFADPAIKVEPSAIPC